MPSLIGRNIPDVSLRSTDGDLVNLAKSAGIAVFFFYPYTGKPGHPDPTGWDEIPGAHGSTPQSLAFSGSYSAFTIMDVKVFGVSFQTTDWQKEFVERNKLGIPLLSDSNRLLSEALGLEVFKAGDESYLARRTIVANNSLITHDFYPIPHPEQNAAEVLKALQS
jgi:peroxiredoxin